MATLKLPEQPGQRKLPWKVMLLVAAVLAAAVAITFMATTLLSGGSDSSTIPGAAGTSTNKPDTAPAPSELTEQLASQDQAPLAASQADRQNVLPNALQTQQQPSGTFEIPNLRLDALEDFAGSYASNIMDEQLLERWESFVETEIPEPFRNAFNVDITYLSYQDKGKGAVVEAIICYGMPSCHVDKVGEVHVAITLKDRTSRGIPTIAKVVDYKILGYEYFGLPRAE